MILEDWNKERFDQRFNKKIDCGRMNQETAHKEVHLLQQHFIVKWGSNHIGIGVNSVK